MYRLLESLFVFAIAYLVLGSIAFPLGFWLFSDVSSEEDFSRILYPKNEVPVFDVASGRWYSIYVVDMGAQPDLDPENINVEVKAVSQDVPELEKRDAFSSYEWVEGENIYNGLGLLKFVSSQDFKATIAVGWNEADPMALAVVSSQGRGLNFLLGVLSVITVGAFLIAYVIQKKRIKKTPPTQIVQLPRLFKLLVIFCASFLVLGSIVFPLGFRVVGDIETQEDFFRILYQEGEVPIFDVVSGQWYSIYVVNKGAQPDLDTENINVEVKAVSQDVPELEKRELFWNIKWEEGEDVYMGLGLMKFVSSQDFMATIAVGWNEADPMALAVVSGLGKGFVFLIIVLIIVTGGAFLITYKVAKIWVSEGKVKRG